LCVARHETRVKRKEKNFKNFGKNFGRIKRVITFAAPKEGKRLQPERDLSRRGCNKIKNHRSAFKDYQGADFL